MTDPGPTADTDDREAGPGTDGSPAGIDHSVTTYLCIGCPLGCRLEVEETAEEEIVEVRGFSCKRGERFARQEHTDPRRMVTTTVAVADGQVPRLPVRTVEPVPKDLVGPLCEALGSVRMDAPVAMGDVVMADALGTGVDVVASRDMTRREAATGNG